MAKVSQETLQALGDLKGVWMQLIQLHFNEMLVLKNEMSGNGECILNEPGCAKLSQRTIDKHPS